MRFPDWYVLERDSCGTKAYGIVYFLGDSREVTDKLCTMVVIPSIGQQKKLMEHIVRSVSGIDEVPVIYD